MIFFEIAVVLLLVLLNGFFAMSELAVVSSRPTRLRQLANSGSKGARVVLDLSRDPSRFLSSVQIGITLIGILAGAFSGATLASRLGDGLERIPIVAEYSDPIAIALVVMVITYLSLIIGELVPKQLALKNAEAIAARVARPLQLVARIVAPLVWLLGVNTNAVLRLLGTAPGQNTTVTEKEIRDMVFEGTRSGIIHKDERAMIEGVLHLADWAVGTIMTPRLDVKWLDLNDPAETILQEARRYGFSRLIVSRSSIDEVIGFIRKKDLMDQVIDGKPPRIMDVLRQPLVIHEGLSILKALELFKKTPVHIAAVVDEYGSLRGILTQTDILEAIAGDLPSREGDQESQVITREDGSMLVDGMISIHDVQERLGLSDLPKGHFHTLAGFALSCFGRIPAAGDWFDWNGWRLEVVDMDGRRIDKLLVSRR
jgi:magnesium and cobalt exporter, CNNM family